MVKIITDTTACLPAEVAQRYGIPVVPQVIHFGTDAYLEGLEMDNAAFMERLRRSKELPKTAAPPPGSLSASSSASPPPASRSSASIPPQS